MALTPNCKQAAALLSRAQDENLGLGDRWRLALHLRLCGNCRETGRQFGELRALVREPLADDESLTPR